MPGVRAWGSLLGSKTLVGATVCLPTEDFRLDREAHPREG